ncbi:Fatty acid-binding protein 1 [Eumeta japonica]|uniref:Fatty acid-binding protein 1 n=1 Tax=Eumeta variegata TaxID=151549 RepID=A0A4C1VB31_EUMVA|nr:Fatty acid-binding protein 1 [Eumeta japonica]
MADFAGKLYVFDRSENDEAYMDVLGVQGQQREHYIKSKPQIRLTSNGDGSYTLEIILSGHTITNTFRSGQEIDEQMLDVIYKTTYTLGNNKLVQVQKHPSGKVATVTREFSPAEVKTISQPLRKMREEGTLGNRMSNVGRHWTFKDRNNEVVISGLFQELIVRPTYLLAGTPITTPHLTEPLSRQPGLHVDIGPLNSDNRNLIRAYLRPAFRSQPNL